MDLVQVVLILAAAGILLWFFNTYVTFIDGKFKQLINIVALVAAIIWLLSLFGVFHMASGIRVGR